MAADVFGITMLNNTISGGREWFSTLWDNGHSRDYNNMSGYDEDDPSLFVRLTTCTLLIEGGIALVSGPSPRLFIEGPWMNTEITAYLKIGVTQPGGMYCHVGSRSNHEIFDINSNRCGFGRYSVKYNHYITKVACDKEAMHPFHITDEQDDDTFPGFNTSTFFGMKTITRTDANNNGVKLEGWQDTTQGAAGGTWTKKTEWLDTGLEPITIDPGDEVFLENCKLTDDENSPMFNCCGAPLEANLTQAWFDPAQHCWLRIENADQVSVKWYSIREIAPIS